MTFLPAIMLAAAALKGAWGGEHIRLEIGKAGARVEYDCAHGTVDGKMVPGRDGRFDLPGRHVEEHGGPVRDDESEGGFAVRFIGRVRGGEMELEVRRDGEVIGTFRLVRGREPFLVKCR